MDTLVESPRVMPNLSGNVMSYTQPKTVGVLDEHFISLTQQVLDGQKPSLSFDKVESSLASGSVSPEVINDLEDAMFGAILQEAYNSRRVSREQIMQSLKR